MQPTEVKVLDHGFVSLVDCMGDDLKVVNSARCSYGKFSSELTEKDQQLIKYLADNAHTTPFRHSALTFHIKAPLALKAQFDKHQIGCACSSKSYRYTNAGTENYYLPYEFRTQSADNKQMSGDRISEEKEVTAWALYKTLCDSALKAYNDLVSLGVTREQARMVLPSALFTEFYMTFSLQALAHFLKLRLHPHAQCEMQRYAEAMQRLATPKFPVSLSALMAHRDV